MESPYSRNAPSSLSTCNNPHQPHINVCAGLWRRQRLSAECVITIAKVVLCRRWPGRGGIGPKGGQEAAGPAGEWVASRTI